MERDKGTKGENIFGEMQVLRFVRFFAQHEENMPKVRLHLLENIRKGQ